MNQDGPLYRYRPLDRSRREIRVLHLQPRQADGMPKSTSLECEIIHVSLDERPSFSALSYTWGNSEVVRRVRIGNSWLNITANLHLALSALLRGDQAVVIWADAVCINQSDDIEKSWQVGEMRQIYEAAAEVLVWLGPDYDGAGEVLGHLESAGAVPFAKKLHQGLQEKKFDNSKWTRLLLEKRLEDEDGPLEECMVSLFKMAISTSAIASLIKRAWWERIWVVQEFASCPVTSFVCDSTKVGADAVGAALVLITHLAEGLTAVTWHAGAQESSQFTVPNFGGQISAMFPLRWYIQTRRTIPFFGLLRMILTHRWQATDPRDYVYALGGLASDFEALGIIIDYRKGAAELYAEVTVALLKAGHGNAFLLHNGTRSGLPSWALDFSNTLQGISVDTPFTAAGETELCIQFASATTLTISGCFVSTVSASCPPCPVKVEDYSFDKAFSWYQTSIWPLASAVEEHGEVYKSTAEVHEALWYAMAAGFKIPSALGLPSDWKPDQPALVATWDQEFEAREKMHRFLNFVAVFNAGQRIFGTDKGYIGIGPEQLREGDDIVILTGVPFPYILRRRKNGQYQCLGKASIYGLMFGEFLTQSPSLRSFILV